MIVPFHFRSSARQQPSQRYADTLHARQFCPGARPPGLRSVQGSVRKFLTVSQAPLPGQFLRHGTMHINFRLGCNQASTFVSAVISHGVPPCSLYAVNMLHMIGLTDALSQHVYSKTSCISSGSVSQAAMALIAPTCNPLVQGNASWSWSDHLHRAERALPCHQLASVVISHSWLLLVP